MPVYVYLDTVTEKVVEVIRGFDEYENPPEREETLDVFTEEEFLNASWKRVVSSNITVTKGKGWGWGKKGHW